MGARLEWNKQGFTVALLVCFFLGGGLGWSLHRIPGNPLSQEKAGTSSPNESKRGHVAADRDEQEKSAILTRVHEALRAGSDGNQAKRIGDIVEELDAKQIQIALAALEKAHLPNRKGLLAQLFERWGELDPVAALKYAQGLDNPAESRRGMEAALSAWAESDLPAAEAWVSQLASGVQKNSLTKILIAEQATHDPRGALERAKSLQMHWGTAMPLVDRIFGEWVQRDPRDAGQVASQLPGGTLRDDALSLIAARWAVSDPVAATNWAYSLLMGNRDLQNVKVEFSNTAINDAVHQWMKSDPGAAVDWLGRLPDDEKRQALAARVLSFESGDQSDPNVILQLCELLPEGMERDRAIGECAGHMAEHDPEAALAWVRGQTDDHAKNVMLVELISNLSGDDLLGALDEVAKVNKAGNDPIGPDSLEYDNISDRKTLATWAAAQPNNQGYVNEIAANWAKRDPDQTWQWLSSLPAATKDGAVQAVIKDLSEDIPDSGMQKRFEGMAQWVAQISDPKSRESTYETLARTWLINDPESARTWLTSAPLPASVKAQLLAPKAKAAAP